MHNFKRKKAINKSDTMLTVLLFDYETKIKYLRTASAASIAKNSDTGINDFLIGLMQLFEKSA